VSEGVILDNGISFAAALLIIKDVEVELPINGD
jgi:hypothetical protein